MPLVCSAPHAYKHVVLRGAQALAPYRIAENERFDRIRRPLGQGRGIGIAYGSGAQAEAGKQAKPLTTGHFEDPQQGTLGRCASVDALFATLQQARQRGAQDRVVGSAWRTGINQDHSLRKPPRPGCTKAAGAAGFTGFISLDGCV